MYNTACAATPRPAHGRAGRSRTASDVTTPDSPGEAGSALSDTVREFRRFITRHDLKQLTAADRARLRDLLQELRALVKQSS